jgi:hypothetical protein
VAALVSVVSPLSQAAFEETVESVLPIGPAWSAIPVGFYLLRSGNHQFAAFYDSSRRLTIAARRLDSPKWDLVVLPENIGWDSHNGIAMGMDRRGCLHLCANMHVSPLVYFRTQQPYDIHTFEQIRQMVGSRESHCTYPKFIDGPNRELIFSYRDGQSGAGEDVYNVYDCQSRTWRRLLDQPLLSGQGKMSAYPIGPLLGPDNYFHLCWVWRDSIDVATNHDLSYACSKDLIHWQTSSGSSLLLPITRDNAEVVDPVPVRAGFMNAGVAIGFDAQKRPIISYLKFDPQGNTQLYDARPEGGSWKIHQISNWNYRWDFHGGGTIPIEIRYSPVNPNDQGGLVQSFSHVKCGSARWTLDQATLQPKEERPSAPLPPDFSRVESSFPGMHVRLASEVVFGPDLEPGVRYRLRWESLDANRDRPRPGPLPHASMLKLVKCRTTP